MSHEHNDVGDRGSNDDDDDDDDDGNTHRAFLQALLSQQTFTLDGAKTLIAHIEAAAHPDRPRLPDDVSQDDFDTYVERTNNALSRFDFELRSTAHQTTRERVYALVNTTSDALTQMATLHGADEIAFIKRVLDAVFEPVHGAEIMAVTGMQALRLAKPPPGVGGSGGGEASAQAAQATAGLTVAQAENVLESMVAEGWFEKSKKGFYSLTPRALMELRGWLVDTYNDVGPDSGDEDEGSPDRVKFCAACRDIVTVGQRCPHAQCPARLHNYCVGKMFRAQGGRQECPTCRTAWLDAGVVGEQAASSSDRRVHSSTGTAGRGAQVSVRGDDSNSDADGDVS